MFLVAVLYSSVGHGGASGYLALFALFGIAVPAVAPVALALNIIVASTSFLRYNASGFFSAKKLLPFVGLSIPAALVGAVFGLISGMTGIGGGVFLSPVLLMARWADVKRSAALSSAFIVLNSLSGLFGQLTRTSLNTKVLLPLVIIVVAGGAIGSYAGAARLRPRWLQVVLSVVLVIAGAKLVLKSL